MKKLEYSNSSDFEIKSSINEIYLEHLIELVAVKRLSFDVLEVVDVIWNIDYIGNEIVLEDNILKVSNKIRDINSIRVSCIDRRTGDKGERIFPIIYRELKEPIIHFIKSDSNYKGKDYAWDFWVFSENKNSYNIDLVNKDEFGYYSEVKEENIIARLKWTSNGVENNWIEQTPTFKIPRKYKSYYIVYGVNKLIDNLEEVITFVNPKIEIAIMDNSNEIRAYLSKELLDNIEFSLYKNNIEISSVKYTVNKIDKEIRFYDLDIDYTFYDLLEVRADKYYSSSKVLFRDILNKYEISNLDLGAIFLKEEINIRLWAPTAYKVELCLYDNWYEKEATTVLNMKREEEYGSYYTNIKKVLSYKKYYLYRLYFKDINKEGKEYSKITYAVDPYANAVSVNGDRGYLIDINSCETKPYGWDNDIRPVLKRMEDILIYELHLRDLTINKYSGMNEEVKGKYLGLAEVGTRYKKNSLIVKTGIDHIKELGVTHIHILPIFDFDSVDERKEYEDVYRNWGYDPRNYNVPEGSYSSNPYNPITRIIELRYMIKTLHKNNLRIIMDVVYNHMYDTKNLDNIVPGYYFRSDYKGKLTNGSGCGNELASEKPIVRKFINDSIRFWVEKYNIDGFRFDLMGLIDKDTIREIVQYTESVNENIIIYGEPWIGGNTLFNNGVYKGMQKNEGFSVFNDTFRDFIRGNNDPSLGFVTGKAHDPKNAWSIIEGMKGSIYTLTSKSTESINYVDSHDNYTLWDQIEKSLNLNNFQCRNIKEIDVFDNLNVRRNILALAIVLFSKGIPFIHGGSEILRTKQGDSNSYKSSDYINELKWPDKVRFIEVFDYIKGLILIRKGIVEIREENTKELNNVDISFLNGDERVGVLKYQLSNIKINKKHVNRFYIIFNATSIDDYDINKFIEPSKEGVFHIITNYKKSGLNIIDSVSNGNLPKLKSYSILVFYY
ncbi:type I pullulanase [Clostridium tertium]|uniref:Pullulanase n=1 Tax=Clostridium tertium TaxID=1559 RepID=A0A6N2Z2W7_9CLOT